MASWGLNLNGGKVVAGGASVVKGVGGKVAFLGAGGGTFAGLL